MTIAARQLCPRQLPRLSRTCLARAPISFPSSDAITTRPPCRLLSTEPPPNPPPPRPPSQPTNRHSLHGINLHRTQLDSLMNPDIIRSLLNHEKRPRPSLRPNRDQPHFEPANIDSVSTSNPDPVARKSALPLNFSEVEREYGYCFVHAVATTRNIHVTITNYKKNVLVSVSAGQLGLKHARRGTIEAGLDTTIKAFQKFQDTNFEVHKVEVVLKGFNKGRNGFLSALSGHHGDFLRSKVVRVTDATPLRIGSGKARNLKRR